MKIPRRLSQSVKMRGVDLVTSLNYFIENLRFRRVLSEKHNVSVATHGHVSVAHKLMCAFIIYQHS